MDEEEYSPDPPGLAMRRRILQSKDRPRNVYTDHVQAFVNEHGKAAFWRAMENSEERESRRRFQIDTGGHRRKRQ